MSQNIEKEGIELRPIFYDATSFEEVFRDFYSPLYRVVYPIIKNRDKSEDVVQELFIKLWQKRESIKISGSIKSYLYRAAVNAAFDYLDKYKRESLLDQNEKFNESRYENQTENNIAQQEIQEEIAKAIEKLPPACRTIFILSREEEMSYKEIAESLEISVKTVENQMGKALKILREELKPYLKEFLKIFILCFFSI